jgi:predicted DNA-binding protein
MPKTRKIQVTLDAEDYDKLAQLAHRDGRKLAAVVRDSIQKYTIAPEADRAKREALDELFSVAAAPVPKDYREWEVEYGGLKTKTETKRRNRKTRR